MALPAAINYDIRDDRDTAYSVTRSRCQDDREEGLLVVGPVHVGQEGDASGAEDHCHYLQVNFTYFMLYVPFSGCQVTLMPTNCWWRMTQDRR